MLNDNVKKPNPLFWVLAVIFLLWNLMGCGIYLAEAMMSDTTYLEKYGADVTAARAVYPIWATAAYAIAVWSGLVAAILFLLRKRLSVVLFTASLAAAGVCFIPTFTNDILREAGGSTFWVMPVLVVVLGFIETCYSRMQAETGILR